MTFVLRRIYILLVFDLWWALFICLNILPNVSPLLYNTIAFISLVCIPGILTITIARLRVSETWGYIAIMAGCSLFELMIAGLFLNTFLPIIGIVRPLDHMYLLPSLTALSVLLATIAWVRATDITITIPAISISSIKAVAISCAPLIFVGMSILGAIRLNNGADGTLTHIMLVGIALYCAYLLRSSEHLGKNVIPTALYFISLSLLLMTSLRGWHITGHDIQREFFVFQLTKGAGLWNINVYRDAYNACMSITILPTLLANMMRIADPYVYKVLFQMFFALVPSVVFISVRRYTSEFIALLSVIYFVAFPTFFTDMPFLGRQEIAFLFLALMTYTLFDESISLSMRRSLFVLFGLGMVLSHYSTTYTVIALLGFVVVARLCAPFFFHLISKLLSRTNTTLKHFFQEIRVSKPRITIPLVLILMTTSFIWGSVLTDTSSNSLYRVIVETIHVMSSSTKSDARSNDVLYGLFSFKHVDDTALFKQYENDFVLKARANSPSEFYNNTTYAHYPVELSSPELLPLTFFGSTLNAWGLNVQAFNATIRQWSAKLLQLFILIGTVAIIFGLYIRHRLDTEFLFLGLGSLIFVFSIVVLPVLSVEYGLLRAFEQSLIFLGVFAAIGSLTIFSWLNEQNRLRAAAGIALLFFMSTTGVFTQFIGGYDPQLHLNNAGSYYDYFYVHDSDLSGVAWLEDQLKTEQNGEYQIKTISGRAISTVPVRQSSPLDDIYPGLIRKRSYVFFDSANVKKGQSAISYQGTTLVYTYPVQFLRDNKDLVYSNGKVEVYR